MKLNITKDHFWTAAIVTAVAIFLATRKKDSVLDSAVNGNPSPNGQENDFSNWTNEDMVYDDHLYKNANGRTGLKF